MKHINFFIIMALSVILLGCQSEQTIQIPSAQTLYHGGDILTMSGPSPEYVDVVVEQEGRIVFTGAKEEALKLFGKDVTSVDLQGATLLPGFIDGHGHLYLTGFASQLANVLPAPDGPGTSFASLIEATQDWIETENGQFIISKLGWVIANGFDDSQLQEKAYPTAEILDKISTEYPVLLIHQSGHLASVNSKALEMIGYDSATPNPKGGIIRRDENGQPNGILEETAFFNPIMPFLMSTDPDIMRATVKGGQEQYARWGYTTAQDGRTTPDASAAFAQAVQDNTLKIDVVSYPDIIWNKGALESEFYNKQANYMNRFRVGGAKLTLDGSPQGKTAWLSHPYHIPPKGAAEDYVGYSIMPDEKAMEHMMTAFENNWQVMVHANGDAAIDQFIESLEAAQMASGYDDHRTVLIHGQTLRKDQISKLEGLDVIPSLFPMHTFYWGDWHAESVLGQSRASYISPMRDVIDAGLLPTSHHDSPVTFPNSMRVLDATVNRVTRSGKALGPNQRITPYEGLKTLTEWAARQYYEEDNKGTLEVGKLADFVILSDNPLKVKPKTIHEIMVLSTIKEGQVIFQN